MISPQRLEELKILFHEDGIEISGADALEAGHWLLERARSVCHPIPSDKQSVYQNIVDEMRVLKGLHKKETVRDNSKNRCKETSNN